MTTSPVASPGSRDTVPGMDPTWERVTHATYRLRVAGGWLYRFTTFQVTPPFVLCLTHPEATFRGV